MLKGNVYKLSMFEKYMKGKRGAEMTIGTIVIIVLAIAVLVFLIYGFGTGWTNLWGKITAFGGGSSNVDTIVQSCALACTSNQVDTYCYEVKTVRLNNKTSIKGSCFTLQDNKIGLSACDLSCNDADKVKETKKLSGLLDCEGLGGSWIATCAADKEDLTNYASDKDATANKGKKCCSK